MKTVLVGDGILRSTFGGSSGWFELLSYAGGLGFSSFEICRRWSYCLVVIAEVPTKKRNKQIIIKGKQNESVLCWVFGGGLVGENG